MGKGRVLAFALTLSGCTQIGVAERAVDYNLEVETARNQELFLNAVRASKRYPMHFTTITQLRSTNPIQGNLGAAIPFGGDAAANFILNPNLNLNNGVSFDVGVLNDTEFTRGILSPITGETFASFQEQGWPEELLFHITIERIQLSRETLQQINADLLGCTEILGDTSPIIFENDPLDPVGADRKAFGCFQLLLRSLLELSPEMVLTEPSLELGSLRVSQIVRTTDEDNNVTSVKTTGELRGPIEMMRLRGVATPGLLVAPGREMSETDELLKNGEVGSVTFRSPQGMLFYLGEILQANNQIDKGSVVNILVGDRGRPVALFSGRRGGSTVAAAVTVRHEDENYHIPKLSPREDRSMHSLSLVTQMFDLLKKSDRLPRTTAVNVVN